MPGDLFIIFAQLFFLFLLPLYTGIYGLEVASAGYYLQSVKYTGQNVIFFSP